MASRKKPMPRPRKATSDRVSTAAAKLLRLTERGYLFFATHPVTQHCLNVNPEAKAIAASALGQDESGRKKRAGRKGTK